MYDPTHKTTVSATLRGFTQQRRGTQGHVQKVYLRSIGTNYFGASSLKNRLPEEAGGPLEKGSEGP